MQRRSLGNRRKVTVLGLGLAALGRPGYINLGHAEDLEQHYAVPAMYDRTAQVLDAAWAAGVRYFDTARSYGRGEEFLGRWLRERATLPETVTIGSKWGYTYTANWQVEALAHEIKEHSLDVFQRQFAESTANLGDYLDLYQIHSATLESGVLERMDVLTALMQKKRQGLLIGLSVSGANQAAVIRRALAAQIDGVRLFDSVQVTWNLLEPSAGSALAEAHTAGMGVIIKEALANGRLTSRNAEPELAVLDAVCARLNCTRDALALAAALTQPWVTVVLSGAATVAHLEANIAALQVAYTAEIAQELAQLVEPPQQYWATRAAMPWN